MSVAGKRAGAGEALAARVVEALAAIPAMNQAFDGPPLQAATPYAVVEAGYEADWSHKSGEGREVRLTVTIRDERERPARLRAAMADAETALHGIGGTLEGWTLVTIRFLRSRILATRQGEWVGVIEYRSRLLRSPEPEQ